MQDYDDQTDASDRDQIVAIVKSLEVVPTETVTFLPLLSSLNIRVSRHCDPSNLHYFGPVGSFASTLKAAGKGTIWLDWQGLGHATLLCRHGICITSYIAIWEFRPHIFNEAESLARYTSLALRHSVGYAQRYLFYRIVYPHLRKPSGRLCCIWGYTKLAYSSSVIHASFNRLVLLHGSLRTVEPRFHIERVFLLRRLFHFYVHEEPVEDSYKKSQGTRVVATMALECMTDIREGRGSVMNRTRDVINTMIFSPYAGGPITIDHVNIVKAYSASPSMLEEGIHLHNHLDMHPQLAVARADGALSTTNMLRSTRRGGSVPFWIHKIYQLDYSRKTGEFRMLE
ncbi:hypothetical protein BDZ89DRAFT_1136660 [Hymenopellis radicata]|nr:hypothetical protein BDZ89DRAFT_1136660 [Hymenopellis radicata]